MREPYNFEAGDPAVLAVSETLPWYDYDEDGNLHVQERRSFIAETVGKFLKYNPDGKTGFIEIEDDLGTPSIVEVQTEHLTFPKDVSDREQLQQWIETHHWE